MNRPIAVSSSCGRRTRVASELAAERWIGRNHVDLPLGSIVTVSNVEPTRLLFAAVVDAHGWHKFEVMR